MKTPTALNKGLGLFVCLFLVSCGDFSFEAAGVGVEINKEGKVSTNGYIDFNTGLNFTLPSLTIPVYDPESKKEIAAVTINNKGIDFNLEISDFLNREVGQGELPNGRPLPRRSHLKNAQVVEVSDNDNRVYYVVGAKNAMVGVAIDEKNLGSYAQYIPNEKEMSRQVEIDGVEATVGYYNENGKKGILILFDVSSVISAEEMIELGETSVEEIELDW